MHFRPPVDGGRLESLGEPEHGAHGCNAELTDVAARKHARLDFHHDAIVPSQYESIGAGHAGSVQYRVDHHLVGAVRRWLEIEAGEVGKFFRPPRSGHIHGDAARGEAILTQLTDAAKIGRSEKGRPVVTVPVEVSDIAQPA